MNVTACLCWFPRDYLKTTFAQRFMVRITGTKSVPDGFVVFILSWNWPVDAVMCGFVQTFQLEGRICLSVVAISSDAVKWRSCICICICSCILEDGVATLPSHISQQLTWKQKIKGDTSTTDRLWILISFSFGLHFWMEKRHHPKQTLISGCNPRLLMLFFPTFSAGARLTRVSIVEAGWVMLERLESESFDLSILFLLCHWSFALNWKVILILSFTLP